MGKAGTSQPTVGEGFHALPAWDEGRRRFARMKWCAGCAPSLYAATRSIQTARKGRRPRRPLRAAPVPRRYLPTHTVGEGFHALPYGVSGKVSATNPCHPSTEGRGVGDAAPYGVCVGVGVSIMPPLAAIRAGLCAPVRPDRLYPRHLRCVRLPPPPNASNPAGAARAPFLRASHVIRPPNPGRAASVRASSAQKGPV